LRNQTPGLPFDGAEHLPSTSRSRRPRGAGSETSRIPREPPDSEPLSELLRRLSGKAGARRRSTRRARRCRGERSPPPHLLGRAPGRPVPNPAADVLSISGRDAHGAP
jgi:hypothetical protein